jgi:redox-sensitive bicupin YhaK (pirin superfamily)
LNLWSRDVITRQIQARLRKVGGVSVKRLLPEKDLDGIGPFIYFDHFGPVDVAAGKGIAVPPHPHIGLATVTYLFSGELVHRDSLGHEQMIRPGEVNWMTAGRGIVHSERTDPGGAAAGGVIHGIQTWVALPPAAEQCPPDFANYRPASLPCWQTDGAAVTVIAGRAYGETSPVRARSELSYVDIGLEPGVEAPLPPEPPDLGIYLVSGAVTVGSVVLRPGALGLLASRDRGLRVRALERSRLMLLGGAPVESPPYLWWNFVASSRARIEQAKSDWRNHRFPPVPGDAGRMDMPGE